MNLKKKILVGYGVALTLMGLVVTWAILNLWSLGQTTDAILHDYYRSILAVENMQDALARQDSGMLLMFMGDIDRGISQYRDNEKLFLEAVERAQKSITVLGEAEVVVKIEKLYDRYRDQFLLLTGVPEHNGSKYALTLETYNQIIFPIFSRLRATCMELRNMNEQTMYTVSEKAGKIARRAIWSTIFVASTASLARPYIQPGFCGKTGAAIAVLC